jgi:immunity protein Imm5 of predicted polymorphic toxin system
MARRISPMTVDQVLASSKRALAKEKSGELAWSWRVRLADAVNREKPKDSLWRQQALSHLTARETLPAFLAMESRLPARFHGLPQRLLEATQRILLGEEISRDEALRGIDHEDQIEAAMDADFLAFGNGAYAVLAAYAALPFEVARHESMYRDFEDGRVWNADYRLTEMDDAYGTWDAYFWCSLVAAGFGGADKISVSRRRAFWSDWLTRQAPRALLPRSRTTALLRRRIP